MRAACLVVVAALAGCSLVLNPDGSELGGGDAGTSDGAVDRDAGADASGFDGGPDSSFDADRPDVPIPPEDGGVDAPPPTDAGCTLEPVCAGGVITTCEGETPCPLGCAPGGEVRCAEMLPSNVTPDLWRPSARDVVVEATGDATLFDTTACAATMADSMPVRQREGGPEVCVLMVRNLTVRSFGFLAVRGSRPLVVMATGDVVIEEEGVIDVAARGATPGPGGSSGGIPMRAREDGEGDGGGAAGEQVGSFEDGGGGGGAFCGAGGDGGTGNGAEGGEGGGALSAGLLIPLRGGSGGGIGNGGRGSIFPGDSLGNVGIGGAGGGAIQISALGSIRVDGFIVAGGGGGQGGGNDDRFSNWGAGGGGGSGGGVLLESPAITIGGAVTTSGGGGGGGASSSAPGGLGEDGWQTIARASGGASGGTRYGSPGGQSGGGVFLDGDNGGSNRNSSANGGGGGGGVGCVVYRTLAGTLPPGASTRTSGSVSPSLENATILLR